MRARYALFVVTIWLLLVAGVVNARFRLIADARLFDATPPRPRERLAFSKLWSGRFQAEAERRLEAWWGLRGYAIRTDNTINYRLFGEARPGKPIVVGHDGWLFHVEDTGFISRTDVCTRCDELAARLARAQRAWLAGGRLLLPIVTAAKTTTERDRLPARWRRFAGEPRSDLEVTGRFVAALEREGVVFVDGHRLMLELRRTTGRPVFPRLARHWDAYPACRVFTAAIAKAAGQLGVPLAADDVPTCTPDMVGLQNIRDLGYVLNVWGIPAAPPPSEAAPPPPTRTDLRVAVIGTSFMWDFVRLLRRTTFGRDARFYYYDDAIFDVATQRVDGKVDANDPAWRTWTLGRNLYLVDLYEAYLPEAGFGPFLDQVDAALADVPYVPTAPRR
jgi:alginate O-acetyltransferase complex protein AlgJ